MRKSRIRELENFLLREMESVDICIELVRIREFDSSGGRIELFKRTFPSFWNSFNNPFGQSFERKEFVCIR